MTGATGRLWVNANGGRLELQSDAGDAQIVWSDTKVTVYDATSNTAYTADLPKEQANAGDDAHTRADARRDHDVPHRARQALDRLRCRAVERRGRRRPTPSTVSPSHDGGLLGSAELAWDATHGVPLKIAIYAQGVVVTGARARGDRHLLRLRPRRPTSRSRRPPARRSSTSRRRRAAAARAAARPRRSPGSQPCRRPRRSRSSRPTRSSDCRVRTCGSSAR